MDYSDSGGYSPKERWKWPTPKSTPYPPHRSKDYPQWEAWAKEWTVNKAWWNQDKEKVSTLHDFAPPMAFTDFITTIAKTFPLGVVGERAVGELLPEAGKSRELTPNDTANLLRVIEQGGTTRDDIGELVSTAQIKSLLDYVALNSLIFQKGPQGRLGEVGDMTLNRRITGWWHHRDYWPNGTLKTVTFAYYYKTVGDPFRTYLNSSTPDAPWDKYFREKYEGATNYHRTRHGGIERQHFHLLVVTNGDRTMDRKNETPHGDLWNVILVNAGSTTSDHYGRPFVVGTKADFMYSGINPTPMKYIPSFVANLTATTVEILINQLRRLNKGRKRKG